MIAQVMTGFQQLSNSPPPTPGTQPAAAGIFLVLVGEF